MEQENTVGLMEIIMKVNGKKVKKKEMDQCFGMMEMNIQVNGS
jgi:hypothetical protein